jgi:integrase
MASIHRRPRSPYWHGAFRHEGRLVLRSTGTTDRAVALRIADEWEQIAKQTTAGTYTESQTREVIAGILRRANLGTHGVKPPSVGEFLNQWLKSKLAGIASGSAWSYRKAITGFLEYLESKTGRPIGAVQPVDARGYAAALNNQSYAPKTVSIYTKVLRAAFKQAVLDGYIPNNPFDAISSVSKPKATSATHRRRGFTGQEVRMLQDAAARLSPDWHTVVVVGSYTGARLRDCCRLRWEDVDMAAHRLVIHQLKTGRSIEMPLHPDLQAHLENRASVVGDRPAEWITPSLAEMETGGAHGLSRQFAEIMQDAGVSQGKTSQGTRRRQNERGFHSLRHTFISALASADVSSELRMKLSGHADLKSHSGYTHTEFEQLAGAVRGVQYG